MCETETVPDAAPSEAVVPSPKLIVEDVIGDPPVVATVIVSENVVGLPVLPSVDVEMASVGAVATATFTVPVVTAVAPPVVAVTVAAALVVSVVLACPDESVVAVLLDNVPTSVVNATGTPDSPLPLRSSTVAVIVDEPPLAGTLVGFALREIEDAAAPPILIDRLFGVLAVLPLVPLPLDELAPRLAAPELAVMLATPDCDPATKVTVALPFFVWASAAG